MKWSRYSNNQLIKILKEGESGMPVTDNCREHGTFQPHITNKSLNIREWISVS